ncbi:DUF707 domain-containing protein [Rhizobium sp. CB3171]|uniref:DUF707 domain-containing protein n=1 Tax=Rhizobium sp. CB3171 TaxID=3039157 RepID=UPI0024B18479|nr:DUF707 domain-containing protein [Rhizobium sp. CB3171]WFU03751.1 DUF707 domain-containing protein [Rhizobium sp. CB3171]
MTSFAASNLQTLSHAERVAIAEQWADAPPLQAEMLSGTFWQLSDLNGRQLLPFVVLAPEGIVGNAFHGSLDHWYVANGKLCILDSQGMPTIVFTAARVVNSVVVALAGHAVLGGVEAIYILNLVDHPPHPVSPTSPHVARRAMFLKQPPVGARRANLVVVRANGSSLHPRWFEGLDDNTRTWDLCVSWYGDETPDASVSPEYLTHAPNQRKFKPIFDLFYEGSPLWDYDRIWLPDDDLLCSGSDLNKMFHLSRKYGLDLAQPSLRQEPGCHINHPITAQRQGRDVRFEPFVEIMCPLFSRRALRICVGSIKDAVSGYGLDHLWPSFLGRPAARMGIIDAVGIVHTRPIGASYDVRSAIAEQAALWNAYGFTYTRIPGVN